MEEIKEQEEKQEQTEGQGAEGVDDLAADVAEKMPPVSEHVVKLEGKGTKGPGGREVGKTDAWGREFDPALHQVKDGRPVMTPGGFLKCQPGKGLSGAGRPKKEKKPKSKVVAPDPQKAEQEIKEAQKEQELSAAAKTATELTFMAGQMLGGPEWAPISGTQPEPEPIDERAMLHKAYYDYFQERGVVNLPPGLALGFVLFTYAVPRLAMPKTASRLQRLGAWARKKLVKMRLLKDKVRHGPRPDTRTDGERQDDTSQEVEPEPKS